MLVLAQIRGRLNQTAKAPEAGSTILEHAIKVVIDALKEKGIRNDWVVLVDGRPLNERSALAVGADVYCPDASVALAMAKAFGAKRLGSGTSKCAPAG
jgi:ketol-acid reductoisomerase